MPEELLNNKIAVVGDEDLVLGFEALGFNIYPLKKPEDFKSVIEKLIESNITICLIQDSIYNANIEKINSFRQLTLPVFVPFSKDANSILLDNILKDIRLKATGAL
ncbi:MAG: V-type ATP synthase subunit F [Candidatus Omnitrophica bacterium]|nr:V-type ATP synthase subunit F [Candidatus Omnitrophota bacterium]HOX54084.1 V-type ATP synthase subunit F [Candidatus Omnitrophota bacterium]